jgi:hypothetical protein
MARCSASAKPMFCTECGKENPASAKFCFACGSRIPVTLVAGREPTQAVAPSTVLPMTATAVAPLTPLWRGASVEEIQRAKTLTSSEWNTVAQEFNEWRKSVTLTSIGRVLTHNSATGNYFAGYRDGLDDGVDRALGITPEQARDIAETIIEAELSSPPRRTRTRGAISTPRNESGYRLGKTVGIVLTLAGVGGVLMLLTGQLTPSNPLPNAVNIALLTLFGIATLLKRPAAAPLGWAYLALLVLMMVAHGFIPLEILQCVALAVFLFYLRSRLTEEPART